MCLLFNSGTKHSVQLPKHRYVVALRISQAYSWPSEGHGYPISPWSCLPAARSISIFYHFIVISEFLFSNLILNAAFLVHHRITERQFD